MYFINYTTWNVDFDELDHAEDDGTVKKYCIGMNLKFPQVQVNIRGVSIDTIMFYTFTLIYKVYLHDISQVVISENNVWNAPILNVIFKNFQWHVLNF